MKKQQQGSKGKKGDEQTGNKGSNLVKRQERYSIYVCKLPVALEKN